MNGRTLIRWSIAALALAGLAAAACGDSGDDDDSGAGGEGRAVSQAGSGDVMPGGARDVASERGGDDSGGSSAPAAQVGRKIIFNAAITLEAEDVARSFDEVGRIAASYGGFVEKSSMAGFSGGDGSRSATVTIRVPAASYQQALGDLRRIPGSEVKEESARSAEVTEEYTDLQSRVRNLERTEQQYLELMSKAVTVDDILTLTDRLNGVRGEIEQVQGRINYLDSLTEMATIDVSVFEAVPARAESGGGPRGIGEAFADAWELSVEGARYFAVAAAYLAVAGAWLIIPAALVVAVLRFVRRHGASAS